MAATGAPLDRMDCKYDQASTPPNRLHDDHDVAEFVAINLALAVAEHVAIDPAIDSFDGATVAANPAMARTSK